MVQQKERNKEMEKEKKYGDLHKVTLIDFSSLVLRVESSIDRFCISDG